MTEKFDDCSACGQPGSRILETRIKKAYRRRRRECLHCGHRWTTCEVVLPRDLTAERAAALMAQAGGLATEARRLLANLGMHRIHFDPGSEPDPSGVLLPQQARANAAVGKLARFVRELLA